MTNITIGEIVDAVKSLALERLTEDIIVQFDDARDAFSRAADAFDNPVFVDGAGNNPWRDAFLAGAEALGSLGFMEPENTSQN